MSKTHPPELKKYMDKRMQLKLNGGRTVSGILRGFDPFMNLVRYMVISYFLNARLVLLLLLFYRLSMMRANIQKRVNNIPLVWL